jgi:hypothetical protein
MNRTQLDTNLRTIGFQSIKQVGFWQVLNQRDHSTYNCANLKEVKTLLEALQEKIEDNHIGNVEFDGSMWIYAAN